MACLLSCGMPREADATGESPNTTTDTSNTAPAMNEEMEEAGTAVELGTILAFSARMQPQAEQLVVVLNGSINDPQVRIHTLRRRV